jgi:hypothetical protein
VGHRGLLLLPSRGLLLLLLLARLLQLLLQLLVLLQQVVRPAARELRLAARLLLVLLCDVPLHGQGPSFVRRRFC